MSTQKRNRNKKSGGCFFMRIGAFALVLILAGIGFIFANQIESFANESIFGYEAATEEVPPIIDGDPEFEGGLRLHFIDVGQGDAAVIELPCGAVIMIDSGGGNERGRGQSQYRVYHIVYSFLRRYIFPGSAPMQIDLFIATHSHADHIGTFDRLMPHMQIGHIVRPITFTQPEYDANIHQTVFGLDEPVLIHNTATFRDVVHQMALQQANHDTKITLPYRGKIINFDNTVIRFYSPSQARYTSQINQTSTIFSVYFQGRRMMFTGDAYTQNEDRLLAVGENGRTVFGTLPGDVYRVDIFDVGHHGSITSNALAFLQKIQPRYAIIQVGVCVNTHPDHVPHGNANTYRHPHQPILDRLDYVEATVLKTRDEGNILIQISYCGTYMEVGGMLSVTGGVEGTDGSGWFGDFWVPYWLLALVVVVVVGALLLASCAIRKKSEGNNRKGNKNKGRR